MGEPGFELIANRPKTTSAEQSFARLQSAMQRLAQANPSLRIRGNVFQDHTLPISMDGGVTYPQSGNLYAFVGNNPLSYIDAYGLMIVQNTNGNVSVTPCPKCPFCLAHWLGANNQQIYTYNRDDPNFLFETCDWKLGEGHYTVVIGPGGSATVDGETIIVPPAKHGSGTVIISDCDKQGDHGVSTGIRG